MVSTRRLLDRWFALGLAVSPVYVVGDALGVDPSAAWAAGLVALTASALLLVARGPAHDSGDAWRFGLYTALSFAALAFAVEYATEYRLAGHALGAVTAWLAALAVAGALVGRRRRKGEAVGA